MRLVELTVYSEPSDKYDPGRQMAINPEYVKAVQPSAEGWVAIYMEGWTGPVYANRYYDRLVAELSRG